MNIPTMHDPMPYPFEWEMLLASIPTPHALRQIRRCVEQSLTLSPKVDQSIHDIYLTYAGVPSVRFSGFLITEKNRLNRILAYCPLHATLEVASGLWRRDVRRQLEIATRVASGMPVSNHPNDFISFTAVSETNGAVPPWLYGLACVPLTDDWDGSLDYPRPFCPVLFQSMAQQPEAKHLVLENPRGSLSATAIGRRVPISKRNREVLQALKLGKSEKEIGCLLGINPHTVHSQIKALYRAYGVHSRGELLASFIAQDEESMIVA